MGHHVVANATGVPSGDHVSSSNVGNSKGLSTACETSLIVTPSRARTRSITSPRVRISSMPASPRNTDATVPLATPAGHTGGPRLRAGGAVKQRHDGERQAVSATAEQFSSNPGEAKETGAPSREPATRPRREVIQHHAVGSDDTGRQVAVSRRHHRQAVG